MHIFAKKNEITFKHQNYLIQLIIKVHHLAMNTTNKNIYIKYMKEKKISIKVTIIK